MRVTATATLIAMLPLSFAYAQDKQATANMMDANGKEVGTVIFTQLPSGVVNMLVEMTDLPAGEHGFHIHETGDCNPQDGFRSAGGHLAGDSQHGINSPEGPHPGDLPNVHVGQNGTLKVEFFLHDVSLSESDDNPLLDGDGSAVVLHAQPDDYESQPAGNSGDRIACGVVESN